MPEQLITTLPRSYHILSRLANSVPGVLPHMRTQNEINWRNQWNATPDHTTGLLGDFSFDGMQRPYSSFLGGLARGADMSENVQSALSPMARLIAAISERPTAQNWMNRATEQDRTFNTFAPSATPVSPVPYRAEGSNAGNPIEPVFLPGQGRMLKRSSVVAAVLQSLRVKQAAGDAAQLFDEWGRYVISQPGGEHLRQYWNNLADGSSHRIGDALKTALPGSTLQGGALGALLGGGLGAGSAWLSDDSEAKPKDRPSYLKRVLLGALLGGGVGAGAGILDTPRHAYNASPISSITGRANIADYVSALPGFVGAMSSGNPKSMQQHFLQTMLPVWQRHVSNSGAAEELKRQIQALNSQDAAAVISP